MTKIICLFTCHNRSKRTSAATSAVGNMFERLGVESEICAVLDNCTDGTYEQLQSKKINIKVRRHFGEDLFWAGGMRHGFETLVKNQNFDYLLCINDDIDLNVEKAVTLINQHIESDKTKNHLFIGSFEDHSGSTSYGGLTRVFPTNPLRLRRIGPSENLPVETFNMNFVLIPAKVLSEVGFLDPNFRHSKADLDLGYRIKAAKIGMVASSEYIGRCERNAPIMTACLTKPSVSEALQCLNHSLREPFSERKRFLQKHGFFAIRLVQLYLPYLNFVTRYLLRRCLSR